MWALRANKELTTLLRNESIMIVTSEKNFMPPPGAGVLIAMSGGVDSAAVAAVLVQAGYRCMGATLRLTGDNAEQDTSVFEPCCGLQAAEDARAICATLGIAHRTLRVVESFERHIIGHFVDEYVAGRTPNPCIRCNRMIKFGLLFREARKLGFPYVAMGHYARLVERNGRMALQRAHYRPKDQSYVLAPLTQAQLRRACFPLGDMNKEEARAIASGVNVAVGGKRESQEICFVSDRNYARVVESRRGVGIPGAIMDLRGKRLGTHRGIHSYTIGQRRGLGISAEKPLYVVRIDAENNILYVGRDEESLASRFETGPLFWGANPPSGEPFTAHAQLRYRHVPISCVVSPSDVGAQIELHTPQQGITPGQWAVFYDDSGYVLASAVIKDFLLPQSV